MSTRSVSVPRLRVLSPSRLVYRVMHHRHRLRPALAEIGRDIWDKNITGLSSMLAYNMLLGVVPLALLGLFVAGQVLSSHTVMTSIEHDLQDLFPGTTKSTLDSLLKEVSSATATTGILALVASLWLASSFWGALDTSFSRIYNTNSRPWLAQKRFGLVMVGVVILFMLATVSVPAAQSILREGVSGLPVSLRHIKEFVYVVSLAFSLLVLFICLAVIYSRVPNRKVPWAAIWPGALMATIAIGVVDFAFPLYLSSISTIARFGTTVIFMVIVLGWFYVMALIILVGGVVNARRLRHREAPAAE